VAPRPPRRRVGSPMSLSPRRESSDGSRRRTGGAAGEGEHLVGLLAAADALRSSISLSAPSLPAGSAIALATRASWRPGEPRY
jgi:hypothetical protein